ncbi:MAG: insulinase family protein [Gemmatimonas sp.]|nr:insulinase family protein [Gemmatimonas sp.]
MTQAPENRPMIRTLPETHTVLVVGALVGCATVATPANAQSDAIDRTVMPAAQEAPEVDFPNIERRTLSNGLNVWIVERSGIPLVTVRLVLDAGAITDPGPLTGRASLTAEMLTEGTSNRSATQIADEVEFLAANLNAGAGRETAAVTLGTLSRNLEPALDLFADVIRNPAFAQEDWDRVQDQRLVSLLQSLDQPTVLAGQEFSRTVYGDEHPYGRRVEGTPETVERITSDDLRAFHAEYYRPEDGNLTVVGDVEADRVVGLLEEAFGGWQGAPPGRAAPPSAPAAQPRTQIFLLDKPGAAQSEVRIGHVGVDRANEDYFPLQVLNALLGGQFTSRINLNLREDKGYTYGASSAFQMGRIAGPFVASGGVQTAVTKESILEFMRELEEIQTSRPATDEEVEFARTSIIRQEPLTLETNAQIAGRLQELIVYGLPLDYFDEYTERFAEVTTADVNRVAREYLRPDAFAIVVVGDRSVIEEGLRTLPYPVEIVAIEAP